VRRRKLMASALGISAGLVTGAPAAAETPRDPSAALEHALLNPPTAQPAAHQELTAALTAARNDFASAHYTALGQTLRELIATAEATRDEATGQARDRVQTCVART
jgi:hypothetical protein